MKVTVLSAAAVTAALMLATSAGATSVDWHDGKPWASYEHPSEKHWNYSQKKEQIFAMLRQFMEQKHTQKPVTSAPELIVVEGPDDNTGAGGHAGNGGESVSAVPVPAAGLLLLAGLGGLAMVRRKS